eukprot:975596_1
MNLTESRAEIRAKSDEHGAHTGKLAAQRARVDQLEQSELSLKARARESEHALRKAERTSEKLGAQVENERANAAEHAAKLHCDSALRALPARNDGSGGYIRNA